jgi:redox-sensitive bicupin YhaK (pirin superfamily)
MVFLLAKGEKAVTMKRTKAQGQRERKREMKQRAIRKTLRGVRAVDGAGVSLVRVLGYRDVKDFDPFLMLDSFDSTDPSDYVAGFPMHPHRGIETITYLIHGRIDHRDSLGNAGTVADGESQWMTAGSGILHEEMPKPSDRMLGLQLWLNLPQSEKMTDPAYRSIEPDQMGVETIQDATVRVLSGCLGEVCGIRPAHIPATIYDITLKAGGTLDLPTDPEETVFVFFIQGDGFAAGQPVTEKTAVLFDRGEAVGLATSEKAPARIMFFSARPLGEPIAWGGPIVMNTRQELETAFSELEEGTFIRAPREVKR